MISVVIACYNAEIFIKPCLDSLLTSDYLNFSIIVVNDSSTDKTKHILKRYENHKKITIVHSSINRGLSFSNNLGAKFARSPYILFLNQDTEVEHGCLGNIVRKFNDDNNVGVIQIKLVTRDKKINTAGHFLSVTGFPYDPWAGEKASLHRKETIVFGAKNAGLATRKKLFAAIDGFDKEYFIYCEDTDLCWRSWINGYKTIFLPSAVAYHFEGSSITPETSYRIVYEGAKNNLNYIIKNAPFPMIIWMPILHSISWLMISIKLLFSSKANLSVWIWKGLWWNILHIHQTLQKRSEIYKNIPNASYLTYNYNMFGPQIFTSLVRKGLAWIASL